MTSMVDDGAVRPAAPAETARARSERFQGVLMTALLAFGAWQGAAALTAPAARHRLAQVLDGPSLMAGRTAAAINYVEAHYLPVDPILRAAGGIIRWRAFASGGPQVAVGCDDWLYLTEELRTWPNAAKSMRARADIVKAVADDLARRGVSLLVAVVPDKARIESGTLCGAPRSGEAAARYGTFMSLLRDRHVPALDLARPFAAARQDGPVYYRTDTHWNQSGAALAARLVADAVTTPLDRGFTYRTDRASAAADGPGDLLRLMSLDHVPDTPLKLRPSPDRQFPEQTVQVDGPAPAGDLLDANPADQIVLLGSSYSVNANFQGRLQEALHAPVTNLAEAGGGFAGAASKYVTGSALTDTPPRLVIWEIPERVLTRPLEADDRALSGIGSANGLTLTSGN